MPVQDADITLKLAFIQAILKDKEFSDIQKLNIAKKILQEKNMKGVNSMINIEKVVVYKNLSSADMRFFLAAGYEPIKGKVLALTDGYYIYDEETDDYAKISEVAQR